MDILRCRFAFTLVELLLAMAVSSVVLAGIYASYRAQLKQHTTQRQVVEMQQNVRAAMYLLEREIRMAGYTAADPPANAGFVADFAAFGSPHAACGASTDDSNIAFTVDHDSSGGIEDTTSFELIAYRYDSADNELQRYDAVSGTWQTAAQRIQNLVFNYFDENGAPTATPADIRSVQITIDAAAGSAASQAMSVTSRVKCRNLDY